MMLERRHRRSGLTSRTAGALILTTVAALASRAVVASDSGEGPGRLDPALATAGVLDAAASRWFGRPGELEHSALRLDPVATDPATVGPVVVILVDTLRPDRLSPFAPHAPAPAPFSERLAAEGVRFPNSFANASWTRPSVASLFSGLLPSNHGVSQRTATLPAGVALVAEHFHSDGWATGAVVSNANVGRAYGFARGYDFFVDRSDEGWTRVPPASAVVARAVRWVEERTDPRFLLTVHLVDPHDPYRAPAEWEKLLAASYPTDVHPRRTFPWEAPPIHGVVRDRTLAAYDAEIAYYEHELGRLVAALEARGWWEGATVVLTSDHGEAFGEHGVYMHAYHLWDEVLRVPLIVRSPALAPYAGRAYPGLVQGADLLPSLLGLVGIEAPPGLDGRSWLGRTVSADDLVTSEVDVYGISGRVVHGVEGTLVRRYPVDVARFHAEIFHRWKCPSANFTAATVDSWYRWPEDPLQLEAAPLSTLPPRLALALAERERRISSSGRSRWAPSP